MKRLYCVAGEFFPDKMTAKTAKDKNGAKIELGPDHWRYGLKPNKGTTHTNSGRKGDGFRADKRAKRRNKA